MANTKTLCVSLFILFHNETVEYKLYLTVFFCRVRIITSWNSYLCFTRVGAPMTKRVWPKT
jgi:hypothetical protein